VLDRFRDHPRVTLRGPVTDLTPLYDSHRVFVAPTRFAAGVPYKVHEAASFGLPVVATDLLRRQLAGPTASNCWRRTPAIQRASPGVPLRCNGMRCFGLGCGRRRWSGCGWRTTRPIIGPRSVPCLGLARAGRLSGDVLAGTCHGGCFGCPAVISDGQGVSFCRA